MLITHFGDTMASIDIHICHEKYSLLHFAWAPTALCSLHVVTGVDCWQFALGHLDICPSIDLCLHIFWFSMWDWTAPSKETKMGKFVLVGWGSTFKLVIVSLSRWVREIWFGRQNGPIFFVFSVSEPKVQVHYCYHALSVFRPSVRR